MPIVYSFFIALLFLVGNASPIFANEIQKQPVPVLMYHSISMGSNSLCVAPSEFEQHLKMIKAENFTPITAKELNDAWQNGTSLPPHPVVITLDDGYADNFTEAYPLILKYGLKATIFMITSKIDTPRYLTLNQLQIMESGGRVDIESHTVNHPDLRSLSESLLMKELQGSKKMLEEKLGKQVEIFCYPAGKYNEKVLHAVQQAGYRLAFTTHNGMASLGQGKLTLHRVRIVPHMAFQNLLHALK